MGRESTSSTTTVRAGTTQGTVSGPNDFKLVINDLTFNTTYARYVDDASVPSVSNKKAQLSLTNPRDACEKFARFT